MDARPLTYTLVRLQLIECFGLDCEVIPKNIELFWTRRAHRYLFVRWNAIWFSLHLLKIFGPLTDYIVLRMINMIIVPVEAWISSPVNEVHITRRFGNNLVVRAMSANHKLIVGVLPIARMPWKSSLLLRFLFLFLLMQSKRGRNFISFIPNLYLRGR